MFDKIKNIEELDAPPLKRSKVGWDSIWQQRKHGPSGACDVALNDTAKLQAYAKSRRADPDAGGVRKKAIGRESSIKTGFTHPVG